MNARDDLPPREDIVDDDKWRVCHSFNSSLPGWLVLVPRRHITAIHDLDPEESARLGPLIASLSKALNAVMACEKTYVIQFAETEGFAHVHFHVVPRMAEFTDEQRGPNVFSFLGDDKSKWIGTEEMDRIALAVRAAVAV
jgi:diadenosine tetraphosphate (Ap4A) HIT family hydrolase